MPTTPAAVARRAALSTSASRRAEAGARGLAEAGEARPQRVDAPLGATVASKLRAVSSLLRTASTSGSAFADIGVHRPDDVLDPGELHGLVGDTAPVPGTARQGVARLVRRVEEALVPRDDEPSARSRGDGCAPRHVGGDQRVARLTPQVRGPPQVCDREEDDGERPAHDYREETARDDHSASQPASTLMRSART